MIFRHNVQEKSTFQTASWLPEWIPLLGRVPEFVVDCLATMHLHPSEVSQPHELLAASTPEALRQKVLLVHERLCQVYGCPIPYFHHDSDPLSELVSALLSHRTTNQASGRAFRQLRQRFASWEAVRDGDVVAIQAAIAPCTWPEQKAPRIKQVLQLITQRRGDLSLDFLEDLSITEARAWLEELPGVGPKTSAAVLCFSSLRRAALPVDSHHHRVAQRLGLIPPQLAVGPSHAVLAAQLPADWSAQQVYDNHEVLMLHGQKCCFYRNPHCRWCTVLDLCPTGQNYVAKSSAKLPESSP